MNVQRCAACPTILRYATADGRWLEVPKPRHTCTPPRKEMWRVLRDDTGTPKAMWWIG